MHYRRIVCFLLGVWLGGGILMSWYGARSFGTVETIMNQSNPAFVVQTKPLGPAVTRTVLRYVVAEQSRWLFRQWENLQIGMAALFFGYLLFGTMEGKFSLSVMLAMLALTLIQRLLISPELGMTGSALAVQSERGRRAGARQILAAAQRLSCGWKRLSSDLGWCWASSS